MAGDGNGGAGGIGETYRKSAGQMSYECLEDGSAPSLVTTLGRHLESAREKAGGQIGLVAHEHPSWPKHLSSVAMNAQWLSRRVPTVTANC